MTAFAPRLTRSALLLGCALAALGHAQRAEAQAFNGNPSVVPGGVITRTMGPGTETITLETPTAIINWVPNVGGDPIIFLPAGNVARFVNGFNVANFAVLNRIFANVPVRFDGTVISRLENSSLMTSVPGGTVIFQSPGGIIIGGSALFDVGNLVLTTLDVTVDPAGGFGGSFIDATGAIRFTGGDKAPNAAVITEPGARILATAEGSYVAMIAPVVQHGGNVRVNGSAAYVAAEAVELRVNAGLFDIIVGTGSDNAVPLIHSGTTGGPASTGLDLVTNVYDHHNIYLVAVPKNQAITAVLQGNIGFDPAISAAVENGAIILSAGHSVVGGAVDRYGDSSPPPAASDATFEIRGGRVTSDLFGYAATDMLASGAALGFLDFEQDVSLFAGGRAHLFAGTSETVTVGGNALISAARFRSADGSLDQAGGEAAIFAAGGGSVDIAGAATVDASAQGVVDPAASVAGSGTGGTATIYADNGDVHIMGPVTVRATGAGGIVDFSPNEGGAGQGGVASVEGRGGGTVRLEGDLAIDASGTGSRSNGSTGIPGANGTGGDAHVAATGGGSVTVALGATLTSNGTGGEVTGGSGVAGGTGQGGTAALSAGGIIAIGGDIVLTANGTGGAGPLGGIANGGAVTLAASTAGGSLTAGNVTGTASATGAAAAGNSPGQWHVTAGTGSLVRFGNLTLTAAVNGPGAALPFSSLEPLGGSILVTQIAALTTPADIRVTGSGDGTVSGGLLDIDAGGDVIVTHSARGANFTIDVADLDIDGRDVTVAAGAATRAANRTDLAAIGALGVGGAMDGREIVATAASVDVGAGGAIGGAATELTDIRVTGNASVAGSVLGRDILLVSNALTIAATGAVGGGATDRTELRTTANAVIAGRVLGSAILATATAVDVAATGAVGDAATQQADLRATGAASVAGTVLGRTINLEGASVAVAGGGTVGGTATDQTRIAALGNAAVGGTVLGGNILIVSNMLNVAASGIVGGAATSQTELRTTGNAAIAGRVLGRSILATAAALDVAATGAVGDAATQQTDLRATGAATVAGTVLGRTIDLQGATVGVSGTVGGAGTDRTRIASLGNAAIAGAVLGRDIRLDSADIDLTGSVGNAGTQIVTLAVAGTPGPGQFTTLGGSAAGPGYTLTNAEAGRIRADTLRIAVPALGTGATRPPDLIVRDLILAGGGAASGIGTLDIVTPGIARVEGNVLLAGARAADGIFFTATERLEVPTPAGSIRVQGAAGAPGGTMLLASNNLWVASNAIIDRLRLDPAYAGRDADLLDNGGADVPRGYVEAGAVTLSTGGTLFVQNSGFGTGTFATGLGFGGVTVGPGGLVVRATGATPATVTAFGRRLNADGSVTTGYDFFFAVDFQAGGAGAPGAGFTPASTFNTCIIVSGQCPVRPPNNAVPGRDPTTGPTGGSDSVQLPPGSDADDLVDTSFATDPLIEEPVTSGGESVIWQGDCDRDDDGDCDEVPQ